MKIETADSGSIDFVKVVEGCKIIQMVAEDLEGDISVININQEDALKLAQVFHHFHQTGELLNHG